MRIVRIVAGLLLLISLSVSVAHAQSEADLLRRINDLRASLGLAPYQMNSALSGAATSHAQWMANSGNVSHTQPNGSTPRTRASSAGYSSQWVSENIYGGTGATIDVAWNFWINSSVHYRGLTNPNYQDVGVGIVRGDAINAFVLVFGNSSGERDRQQLTRSTNNSGTNGENAAPPPPPSFVVGVDAYGNIMHEIQPSDTLGDIALLYGYTWDDIPYMMELNELDDTSVRELKIGAVFLVPPHDGTYTPTPGGATMTPTASPTPDEPTSTTTLTRTPTQTQTPIPTARLAATAAGSIVTQPPTAAPTLTTTPAAIAAAPQPAPPTTRSITPQNTRSPWLFVAVGVQVLLVLGAGIELVLRRFRR